jgi:phytoene dehydrogenase-like protein
MSAQRFVVVGGGVAGFSAAIELADSGNQVTLCEQSWHLGGRAATHHEQGYAMNIGPHGFYRAGIMRRQFDAWGIRYSGKAPLTGGRAFLIANRKRHRFPTSTMNLLRSSAFSLRGKVSAGQALQKVLKTPAAALRGQSMEAWIQSQAGTEEAARLIAALVRLSSYSADLHRLDAGAAIEQIQLALAQSVLYLDGGWETLVAGLEAKAKSLGVEIRAEWGVKRVEQGAVESRSGERIAADGIVLAIPPKEVERVTGVELPAGTPARAACLDLGMRRLPEGAASFALGLDAPVYFSVHSLYARGLAPEGGALVQIAKYLDRNASGTRAELESVADLAMPGWRDEVEVTRFLPEMTVAHTIPEAGRGRPDIDTLKMPGVMIAGDWVGPEGMLADAAVASGLRAARALVQRAAGKAA